MGALRERWADLSRLAQTLVAVVVGAVMLFAAYRLPGLAPFLRDKAPFGVVVAGVIFGSVTALLAIGLILIYRTNRFVNFAYGSMAATGGILAIALHLEKGWNFFLALPVGVAFGMVLGALIDTLIIRRFQNASRLVLTVGSIGLAQLLGYFELRIADWLGFVSLTGGFRIPGNIDIDLGVKTLTSDEMLIVGVVPPIILVLAWFLLRTDAGVAVRAAAENADRALLLGIPIRRLSTIVWIIAGGLAALTFVLKAPFSGVSPGIATGPTVLLPALAAAVVARMESLPIAFAAGVALGVMEQVVLWNTTGSPTFQYVVFLVVILAALLLQRGKLSRAQESGTSSWSSVGVLKPIPIELRRLPEVRIGKGVVLALLGAAFLLVPATWGPSNQLTASFAIVWGMAAISLVILTGWGGHISLGQFAIVGVGALLAGNLVVDHNIDFFLGVLLGGTAGAVISLVVGLPALRIRGLFLAVTTLAFAIALDIYFLNFNNFPDLIPTGIERPLIWERFDLNDGYNMYVTCLAFLVLSVLAAHGVRKARAGRVIIATRDNERAADAAAVPTTGIKLSAFLVAGVISGVAGTLHMYLLSSLNPGSYAPLDSITLFATAVIGGLGSIAGALMGVLLFRYLETITALGELRLAISGTALLVVLLALPGGIGQVVYSIRDRILRIVADRRGIVVPSLVADKRTEGDDHAADEVGLLQGALSTDGDRHPETVGV